jgi:hypothetical protein
MASDRMSFRNMIVYVICPIVHAQNLTRSVCTCACQFALPGHLGTIGDPTKNDRLTVMAHSKLQSFDIWSARRIAQKVPHQCFPFLARSYIVDLTPARIRRVISGSRPVLVMFTSPKCEPYRDLREDFDRASNTFTNVTFATLNCASHATLCDEDNVSTHPEFCFFFEDTNDSVLFTGFRFHLSSVDKALASPG